MGITIVLGGLFAGFVLFSVTLAAGLCVLFYYVLSKIIGKLGVASFAVFLIPALFLAFGPSKRDTYIELKGK